MTSTDRATWLQWAIALALALVLATAHAYVASGQTPSREGGAAAGGAASRELPVQGTVDVTELVERIERLETAPSPQPPTPAPPLRDGANGDVLTLGCVPGAGVAGNALEISRYLADKANRYPLTFPGGYWAIEQTIVVPTRTGLRIEGNGRTSDVHDGTYDAGHEGGPASRLVWEGPEGGTMLQYNARGAVVDGLAFQGRRRPLLAPSRKGGAGAQVGVHVRTAQQTGIPTGKGTFRDLTFIDVPIGMLFGYDARSPLDTVVPELSPGPVGEYNNADESMFDHLHFYYPYNDGRGQERTCIKFRTGQALAFTASHITVNGHPNEVFWFERGGKFFCQHASINGWIGAKAAGATCTLLRLGDVGEGGAYYDVGFDFDATNSGVRLLQMDNHQHTCHVVLHGKISHMSNANGTNPEQLYAVPTVVARGTCKVVLRDVTPLQAGSIRLIGQPDGGHKGRDLVAWVHLENCNLKSHCRSPADLIDKDSRGPYVLSWSHCALEANDDYTGQPFADGEVAVGVTRIEARGSRVEK